MQAARMNEAKMLDSDMTPLRVVCADSGLVAAGAVQIEHNCEIDVALPLEAIIQDLRQQLSVPPSLGGFVLFDISDSLVDNSNRITAVGQVERASALCMSSYAAVVLACSVFQNQFFVLHFHHVLQLQSGSLLYLSRPQFFVPPEGERTLQARMAPTDGAWP